MTFVKVLRTESDTEPEKAGHYYCCHHRGAPRVSFSLCFIIFKGLRVGDRCTHLPQGSCKPSSLDVQELGLGCCLNERHLRNGKGLEAKRGLQASGEGAGKRSCWGNAWAWLRNQMGCEDGLQQLRDS